MTGATLRTTRGAMVSACLLIAASYAAAQPATTSASGGVLLSTDTSFMAANEPARDYKAGKIVHARRIAGAPPQIDGRLTDEVWGGAQTASGLIQRDPDNGNPMTEDT